MQTAVAGRSAVREAQLVCQNDDDWQLCLHLGNLAAMFSTPKRVCIFKKRVYMSQFVHMSVPTLS